MLTIWGRLNSHNVKKVVWLAQELDLPHVRHDVGGQFGMDDAYRAKNPNALVPTIEDGDIVLWESNTILRYLAARHGGGRWCPADPVARALAERWMDWHFGYAEVQRPAFVNLVRRPPADRDPAAIARSVAQTGALLSVLDRHLANHQWLSGPDFGIGDIPCGAYVNTWFQLPVDRPDLPHLARWYAALRTRPAYADTVMIPLT